MNDTEYHQLRELSWRRKLTGAEEAELQKYLAAHPEAKADWETDAELNRVLDGLPAAPPVASNFTARVVQAVERETAARARAGGGGWFAQGRLWNWLPRAAAACVVAGVVLLGYHEHQARTREAMARRVVDLARAVSASPELLANYDHIRRLGDTPPKADTDLLALLK
jgi:hypothetical protein